MKRIVRFVILFTLITLVLSACAAGTPPQVETPATSTSLSFVDGLGRTVTLAEPAQRIVSLAPSATEILYAVGAGDQMVGRDSFSNYPEEALSLADVGGSMGDYSNESIAALNPDLVIAAEINTADQVKALEDLGITVYYIANPNSLDDLFSTLVTVGQMTGHEGEAQSLSDSLKQKVQSLQETISKASTTPVVFYELDGSDPAKPWTSGPGTFMDQLIKMAGGVNVGSSLQSSWAQISVEELLVQNPDIILLGDGNYGVTADQVAERPGWSEINAVKEDKIYSFNDDLVSRAGPRLVEGLETLAKLIHPELFQ